MTREKKEEMSYYKEQAVAVENRLAALRSLKRPNCSSEENASRRESYEVRVKERLYDLDNDLAESNLGSLELDASASVSTVIQLLPKTVKDLRPSEAFSKYTSNALTEERSDVSVKSSNLNSEDENDFRFATRMVSRSDSLATSVDLSQALTDSNTTETTPEAGWKPQVPKTLDVVPLARPNPDPIPIPTARSTSNCSQMSRSLDIETERDGPKLVRQGSYVLDNPSPMLLAHMQTEFGQDFSPQSPCEDYVPTSTALGSRRREWNIAQAKVEWEQKYRSPNNFASENNERRISNSVPTRKASGRSRFGARDSTRSVDCIQAMLAREYIARNNARNNQEPTSENSPQQRFERWRGRGSFSIMDLAQKLGGSLGNLNLPVDREEKGREPKPRTSVTTNKLLTVYKEIQRMHTRQMAELVSRQQKEQNLLQKEFEKQQLLLLTEIKKSFPEMTLPFFSENATCQPVPENERPLDKSDAENGNELPQSFGRSAEDIRNRNEICPLDLVYPRDDPLDVSANVNGEQKRPAVSRRLFPLDGKTVHVPIIDGTAYEKNHITAANVINAYARGYLVRRLMKTERVIALKNTYREALHCMIKLHVDAPLDRSEFNFLHRLQLQCDAASMNIAELFGQSPAKRMEAIEQDREVKRLRAERPTSERSYSFATQRTLARKKLKEMGDYRPPSISRSSSSSRSRCQTWTSDVKEKLISPNVLHQSIKRSTSAGTVRKPWR